MLTHCLFRMTANGSLLCDVAVFKAQMLNTPPKLNSSNNVQNSQIQIKMGYIKHHTIVVTGWQDEKLKKAHQKAKEVFEKNFESEPYEKPFASRLVSDIIKGLTNGQSSFFIAPDGSKEGWATSDNGDNARKEFLDWLQKADKYCDYVEVSFGGDDEHERIVRSKDTDLNRWI